MDSDNPSTLNMSETLDLAVLEELKELSESEPDFLKEIIDMYLVEAPQKLCLLHNAVLQDNAENIYTVAHSMKSISANVGAKIVSDLCKELESKARVGITSGAEQMLTNIASEYEKTQVALKHYGNL